MLARYNSIHKMKGLSKQALHLHGPNLRVVFPLRGPRKPPGRGKMGKNYRIPLPGPTPRKWGKLTPKRGKITPKIQFL